MAKEQTKKLKVLTHLKSGKTITQPQAAKLYNAWRLSGIIKVLRDEGHDIVTTRKGKTGYGEYKLDMGESYSPPPKFNDESASWGGGPEPYEPNVYDGTYSEE